MMPPTLQHGKKFSEELEREHDIRNLKETITALRTALEKQKADTAEEVSLAVAEAHAQIQSDRRAHRDVVAEFERTVQELRAHLEVHHGKK